MLDIILSLAYKDDLKKEIYSSRANIYRLKKDIGYVPSINGIDMVRMLIKYYLTKISL